MTGFWLAAVLTVGLLGGCTSFNPATGQNEIDYGATAGVAGAAMGAAALGVALSNNNNGWNNGPMVWGGGGRNVNVVRNNNVNVNNANLRNNSRRNQVNHGPGVNQRVPNRPSMGGNRGGGRPSMGGNRGGGRPSMSGARGGRGGGMSRGRR